MLFTVSTKASSFGGLSNIGSTKTLLFSGFGQNAQINLLTCKSSDHGWVSESPDHEVTPKNRATTICYNIIVFVHVTFARKIHIDGK